MGSEWTETRLGEVTEWSSGGTPPKNNPTFWDGGIPWISASSMKNGKLFESDRTLTPLGLATGSKLAPKGTVLLLVRGSELHKRIPIGIASVDVAFNQDVKAIKSKNKIMDKFLYYWLLSNKFLLLSKVEFTGIGAGKLDTDVLKNLPFLVPPITEQRAIAHILGTLDDKIELNRRMNQTLEEMARALFKSWFVDFDPVRAKAEGRDTGLPEEIAALFPDEFEDSELGEIPKGWKVTPLSNQLNIIGGGTPKTSVAEYWNGNIPWFSVTDTPAGSDVFVIATERTITEAGLLNSSARLVSKGTTIISARGTVGNLAITGCDMAFNQSCYGLKGIDNTGYYYVYLLALLMVERLKNMAHGSVFSTITRQTFEAIVRPLPCYTTLRAFEQMVSPLFGAILSNVEQSRTLATLRDTLLPKLLSGELRIEDAERFTEASGA